MASTLSENHIKRIALHFLKGYYKYRPRTEKHRAFALLDQKLEGNITVDVMLIFGTLNIMNTPSSREKPPEERALELFRKKEFSFIATCEATSKQVKEELYYQFDKKLWLWESLAIALFFCSGLFLYAQIAPNWFPPFMQPFLLAFTSHNAMHLLGFAFAFTACFSLLFALINRYWNKINVRYRYIYAIRQFKAYKVDEQWIAFGEDVFQNKEKHWKNNKYFKELQRQALTNGVGLLLITQDQKAIPIITAARKKQTEQSKGPQKNILPEIIIEKSKTLKKIVRERKKQLELSPNISRLYSFQKSIHAPIFLSLLFTLIISIIIFQHYRQRPGPRKSSHAAILKQQQPQQQDTGFLVEYPYIDTPFWPVNLPFLFDSTRFIDPITLQLIRRKEKPKILLPPRPITPPSQTPTDSLPDRASAITTISSDCITFDTLQLPAYAVLYSIWPQKRDATTMQLKLKEQEILSYILPANCFELDMPVAPHDQLLILGHLLHNRHQAQNKKLLAEKYLREKSLLGPEKELIVVEIKKHK